VLPKTETKKGNGCCWTEQKAKQKKEAKLIHPFCFWAALDLHRCINMAYGWLSQ
jgi:hypothetical protein